MDITTIDWAAAYRHRPHSNDKALPGSDESREFWDAKASSFAKKPQRSDYIFQLLEMLDLREGETVFDMGCGSGTLAIPLAREGHAVVAVDFSSQMLGQLREAAEEAGVGTHIETFQRSWQETWEGLPKADVAISSRSFVTDDLADGIGKLEGQARRSVVLTCGAGDLPYRDARVFEAMGRAEEANMPPDELMIIAGYLWAHGRFPKISYIEYPGVWQRPTREAMEETVRRGHTPRNAAEEAALNAFLAEHMVQNEAGQWMMDYPRCDRWAVLQWEIND